MSYETRYAEGRGAVVTDLSRWNIADDADITPSDRAAYVERIIMATTYSEDTDNAVRDLLADVMHYCVARRIDFRSELDAAARNFREEVQS